MDKTTDPLHVEKGKEGVKKVWLTWCTNTSTGISKGLPSRFIMEMNPNPIRTLNHLQWPVPCKTWDSSSTCSGSFPGSSPPPLLAPPEWNRTKKVSQSVLPYSSLKVREKRKKKKNCLEAGERGNKKNMIKWLIPSFLQKIFKMKMAKRGSGGGEATLFYGSHPLPRFSIDVYFFI